MTKKKNRKTIPVKNTQKLDKAIKDIEATLCDMQLCIIEGKTKRRAKRQPKAV
jgi:hypothetical protein